MQARQGLAKVDAAAVKVIGQLGFAETSTAAIAREAGVSEGLIFKYYKTKLDMGLTLFARHHERLLNRLAEVGQGQTDPVERIRFVAKELYKWFDEDRDVAHFLLRTHQEFIEKLEKKEGIFSLAQTSLRSVLGEPLFLLFPGDILSAMIVGAFMQVLVECMHGQVVAPLAPRMGMLIDALVGLLTKASRAAGRSPEAQG